MGRPARERTGWAKRDPGLQALRRAARVALVSTGMLVLGLEIVHDTILGTYGMFAAFALLGFADFGGPPRHRVTSYLLLTVAGAALIALGTALSNTTVAAVAVMVVVGFGIRLLGAFGGAWYASVSPAILAYVLAVTIPADLDALPDRLGGWCIAGALSTVAALVLWTRSTRPRIRSAAADLCEALAARVQSAPPGVPAPPELVAEVRRQVDALRAVLQVPLRPAGPGVHDSATRLVVDGLRRIDGELRSGPISETVGELPPPAADLTEITARALRAAAQELRGTSSGDELDTLVRRREEHLGSVATWASERLRGPEDAPAVVAAMDAAFPLRLVTSLALSTLANAIVVRTGRTPESIVSTQDVRAPGKLGERVRRIVQLHAQPRSPGFQDAVRAGLGLGLAVLVAGTLALDHAFWVALGTLSVLRSNAFKTGSSALYAALGTAIGFAATSLLFAVVGPGDPVLWTLTAAGLFFAAYAPTVFGFVEGQVAFTVAVVGAFNLVDPRGWRTGLVRVQDIAIGGAISLVVAFLFWPRRQDRQLRAALASTYRALGPALLGALRSFRTGHIDDAPLRRVRDCESAARENYRVHVDETGRTPGHDDPWGRELALAAQLRMNSAALPSARHRFPGVEHEAALDAYADTAQRIVAALDTNASRLETGAPAEAGSLASAVDGDTTPAAVHALEACAREGHDVDAALGVLWVREALIQAAALTDAATAIEPA